MHAHPVSKLSRSLVFLLASLFPVEAFATSEGLAMEPGWRATGITLADIDDDGVRELVVAEAGPEGAARLRFVRGPVFTSCFPDSQRRDTFETIGSVPLSRRADFLAAADLDADGHSDLLVAEARARRIVWFSDPQVDALGRPRSLELGGSLVDLHVTDIDRQDGLDDLVVVISGDHTVDSLVLFAGPQGAAVAAPEMVDLPKPITSVSWGRFPAVPRSSVVGLQVQAGGSSWRVDGREVDPRSSSPAGSRRVEIWEGEDHLATTSELAAGRIRIRDDGTLATLPATDGLIFRVNSLLDGADADPADGICDIAVVPTPSGICTLRAAVEQANATPGPDTVHFALPGAGPHELAVGAADPIEITEELTIDATSQAGYLFTPVVEVAFAGGGAVPGLSVIADDVLVCGLSITGFPLEGIVVTGDRVVLEANWIGVEPSGAGFGNLRGISSSGRDGRIGGPGAASNLVSSNTTGGIFLGAAAEGNKIVGNRVGTNATGQAALPNGGGPGIRVEGHSNVIGGTGSGSGNLISG
ncbi:MAG: VCBS repeat-containing protein, partial [Acidobacteriota bacterium]